MQVNTLSESLRAIPKAALALAAVLGVLTIVAWVVVVQASMPMAGLLDPLTLFLFTAIWGVGMVAMMFPSLLPMIYAMTLSAGKSLEDREVSVFFRKLLVFVRGSLFILGYVAIWTLIGVVFYLAIAGLTLVGLPVSFVSPGFWAGLILIAVGLYQFTRFKQGALMKCRSPMGFMFTRWRNGNTGAGVMGADYGLFCSRCCWVLMAGLLTVGAMSLPLMGVFSIIIFAEKMGPFGHVISRLVGVAFLAAGIALIL